jgi:hypothetical protein
MKFASGEDATTMTRKHVPGPRRRRGLRLAGLLAAIAMAVAGVAVPAEAQAPVTATSHLTPFRPADWWWP